MAFLALAAQLGLLLYVVYSLHLESRAFFELALLVGAGFLVHAWLPLRLRLPFFALLSIGGLLLVLRADGGWVLGVGAALIGLCHLPISLRARVGTLLAAGGLLAVLRVGWMEAPWSGAIWPVLASMFMFRLIVYLFDQREAPGLSLPWATAYFFMLPNPCFPLFPVVDYRTFRESHYRAEPVATYQRGLFWMARGLTHIVLYRFLTENVPLGAESVDGPLTLAAYMLGTYLLYLQVSGQFHLIAGTLLLFGFDLPETNHKYLLAASFTDFWRRINIYWKDFMTKVFYFPIYFRARKLGRWRPAVVATVLVFLATWLLHGYQWFWLLGTWLLSWKDVAFWTVLGVLVLVNVLREGSRPRRVRVWRQSRTPAARVSRACYTVGVLATISILWSLWTSDSIAAWLSLWRGAGPGSALVALLPAAGWLAGTIVERRATREGRPVVQREAAGVGSRRLAGSPAVVTLVLLGLAVVSTRQLLGYLPNQLVALLEPVSGRRFNDENEAQFERGYYGALTGQPWQNPALWVLYARRPLDWRRLAARVDTQDFLLGDLLPDQRVEFKGCTLTTNRWGMRDRDYEKARPAGTFRIAFLGSSHVMGAGVCDPEVFEAVVETELASRAAASSRPRFELLNFAVGGRFSLRQVPVVDRALEFEPDVVVLVAHPNERQRALREIKRVVNSRVDIPYPDLRRILAAARVEPGMAEAVAARLLEPHTDELLAWAYGRIAAAAEAGGARAVWLYMPMIHHPATSEERARETALARAAGFEVVDIEDAYDEVADRDSLQVAKWDTHPNAAGHRLVAEHLLTALAEHNYFLPSAPEARVASAEETDDGSSR